MAVTQNTYTGNGSTVLYSFTFPYLKAADIKVSVNGTTTTAYTLANATTIQFNTAPVNGAAIRIYRETDDSALTSTFYPGSAIRSQDLNDNFTQNLYVTQESVNTAASAVATANSSVSAANTASTNATSALTAANSAVSTANAASATANSAATNASNAVTVANAASGNASTALSTANTALTTANTASTTATTASTNASTALSTANTASTNATAAVTTANTAASNASTALSTANTAASNASTALSTANTALSNSTAAVTTANAADNKANAAIAAVASSINYTAIANVAAIPGSPTNNTYIEVQDTTGLESFSPLTGRPGSFVGDSGLKARIRYTTSGSTWVWIDYSATDQDGRYLKKTGGTMTGALTLSGAPSSNLHAATKAYVDAADATLTTAAAAAQTTANTGVSNAAAAQSTANTAVSAAAAAQATANAALPKAGGTMTGNITFNAGQTFPTSGISSASTSAAGIVQLSDATNSSSSSTAATSAAVKATYDFASIISTTANAALPKAGGTITGNIDNTSNGYFDLPAGTTAQRPGTANSGMIRFNSDLGQFEGYNGTAWSSVGGGATGGGADRTFMENDNQVTQSYTVTAGRNAVSAGPITINNGATVVIPSGSNWVIV